MKKNEPTVTGEKNEPTVTGEKNEPTVTICINCKYYLITKVSRFSIDTGFCDSPFRRKPEKINFVTGEVSYIDKDGSLTPDPQPRAVDINFGECGTFVKKV